MWFLPTAQTPTRPWKVGQPVIPLASLCRAEPASGDCQAHPHRALRTEVARPLGGGGMAPGLDLTLRAGYVQDLSLPWLGSRFRTAVSVGDHRTL